MFQLFVTFPKNFRGSHLINVFLICSILIRDILALFQGERTISIVDFANFDLEFHSSYNKFN